MANYIKATQTQMTRGQHEKLDRRMAQVKANRLPAQIKEIYVTADQQYRVVQDVETQQYFVQEQIGFWNYLRKDSVLYRTFVRENAAKKFVDGKATPAEML